EIVRLVAGQQDVCPRQSPGALPERQCDRGKGPAVVQPLKFGFDRSVGPPCPEEQRVGRLGPSSATEPLGEHDLLPDQLSAQDVAVRTRQTGHLHVADPARPGSRRVIQHGQYVVGAEGGGHPGWLIARQV
nr:hypothetical protein [Micromonospora sp. DSM 115978]